jgi:hypothetical protein
MAIAHASAAWLDGVRRTGTWTDPQYWRTPEYLRSSPWSEKELGQVFGALEKIYDPPFAREVFAKRRAPVFQLLCDPWAARVSKLIPLGMDAFHAEPWRHRNLYDALRAGGAAFRGAELELALLAACRRAGLPVVHEPLARTSRRTSGLKSPDFRLDIGSGLFVEAKAVSSSHRSQDVEGVLLRLIGWPDQGERVPTMLTPTPEFERLCKTASGLSLLRKEVDLLIPLVHQARNELGAKGLFPASTVVGGLVNVEVTGPPDDAAAIGIYGPAMDEEYSTGGS